MPHDVTVVRHLEIWTNYSMYHGHQFSLRPGREYARAYQPGRLSSSRLQAPRRLSPALLRSRGPQREYWRILVRRF